VALQRSTWNRKKAAKMLDIDYKGLLYKMKKLEIA
jgi:transcriptional regulator with GAF, ATPase, and Fis domain